MKKLFLFLLAAVSVIAFDSLGASDNYGSLLPSVASYPITTVPAKILNRNEKRTHLFIQNTGTKTVYIKPNSANVTYDDGILLTAGSTYEPVKPFIDSVYVDSASYPAQIYYFEGQ